jgi:hypothetical protein
MNNKFNKIKFFYNTCEVSIKEKALKVISGFVNDYLKKEPLEYLRESDIQTDLAYLLNQEIREAVIEIDPNINEKVRLVICEYPASRQFRFDITYINPFLIEQYFDWLPKDKSGSTLRNFVFWELPLLFAIEIKYTSFGNNGDPLNDTTKDIKKLQNYKDYHTSRNNKSEPNEKDFTKDFEWLCMHFYQDKDYLNEIIAKQPINLNKQPIKFNKRYVIGNKIYGIEEELIVLEIKE